MASAATSFWQDCFASLERIANLRDDWDGEGALAPRVEIAATARKMLEDLHALDLAAPSRVGAGPNGTILIEWQNGGSYFEIEIVGLDQAEWMIVHPGSPALHGEGLAELLPHLAALAP